MGRWAEGVAAADRRVDAGDPCRLVAAAGPGWEGRTRLAPARLCGARGPYGHLAASPRLRLASLGVRGFDGRSAVAGSVPRCPGGGSGGQCWRGSCRASDLGGGHASPPLTETIGSTPIAFPRFRASAFPLKRL